MFNSVLVVCVGNICRSPTAQVLFEEKFLNDKFSVDSAGLSPVLNSDIEETARTILLEHGITPKKHCAKKLTRELIAANDLILVMEKAHIKAVLGIAPEAKGKVFLLGKWLEDIEVTDPYKQSKTKFSAAYDLIEQSVDAWIKAIK